MAALEIAAEATEVTVEGTAASIGLTVAGGTNRSTPVISLRFTDPSAEEWVSAHLNRSARRRRSGVVTFDPSVGRRPRAGAYLVELSVADDGKRASTAVRFVVRRHPCLRFGPRPSWSWDPFTQTVTVTLRLWNCGNVDLNLTWSAQLEGRRLRVHSPAVEVPVDGGWVDATLTIDVPRGTAEVETELDLEAVSDAEQETWRVPSAPYRSVTRRRGGRLVHALLAALVVGAGVLAVMALRRDDDPVVVTDTTAPGPASAATLPSPPSGDPPLTEMPAPETGPPPVKAHITLQGEREQVVAIAVGQSAQVSFIIGNDGGSPAELGIGEFQADAFLTLGPGTCGGALEPFSTCSVEISFDPGEPGTYEGSVVVEDASTGDQLPLSVTGIAGTIDLQVVFASDAVRTTGCPDDEPVCLAFLVLNAGTATSPAAIAEVESGETRLRVDVPPLEAGSQVELVAGTGPSCTNDCGASVVVDPAALVPESDEQNNTDSYTEVG